MKMCNNYCAQFLSFISAFPNEKKNPTTPQKIMTYPITLDKRFREPEITGNVTVSRNFDFTFEIP